ENDALKMLEDRNINAKVYYVQSDKEEVKYSIPSFGSNVKINATISLYIGKTIPNYYESFVGLMLEQNIDYINEYCKENAISYTVIYEENNDEIPGVILEQSLTCDNIVKPGDELIFKVSSSNQYIQMPSLSGLSVSDALEFLNENNLNANLIYYYAPIDEDIIISQSIEEGIVIKKGNKHIIDLYVSKGMPYDLTSINIDNFIEVLIDLNINYDIIVVESNIESNKAIAVVGYSDDDLLAYSLYISK
ncbi:MAG: PASTA domain-containing protein, partial [Acholeplasmatales bacterium]|nr:PASTA domain-containing protein [Acholeplasmatales bacterium]